MKLFKKLLVLILTLSLGVTLFACTRNSNNRMQTNRVDALDNLNASITNITEAADSISDIDINKLTINQINPSFNNTSTNLANTEYMNTTNYSTLNNSGGNGYLTRMQNVYNTNTNVINKANLLTTGKQSLKQQASKTKYLLSLISSTNVNLSDIEKEAIDSYSKVLKLSADNIKSVSKNMNISDISRNNLTAENLDITNASYADLLAKVELINTNITNSTTALNSINSILMRSDNGNLSNFMSNLTGSMNNQTTAFNNSNNLTNTRENPYFNNSFNYRRSLRNTRRFTAPTTPATDVATDSLNNQTTINDTVNTNTNSTPTQTTTSPSIVSSSTQTTPKTRTVVNYNNNDNASLLAPTSTNKGVVINGKEKVEIAPIPSRSQHRGIKVS